MALTKITSDVIAAGAVESTHIASGAISSSHLSSITTDNVSEGSSNTYFTNARARGSVSVTGGGLSYDSGTGVIQIASIPNASLANSSLTVNSNSVSLGGTVTLDTDDIGEGSTNLYFTNARAQGAISGGTGVTVSSGTISIGQDVATSSTPTFGNITTTGYIAGPATFTIDPAAVGDNTGTVVIAGNLQVDGTTTTINSTTMTVDDLNITLASGAANAAAANGAGITVDGASATITYDGTNDEWDFNKPINLTGDDHDLLINSADYELVLLGNRGSTGVNLDKAYLRMKAEGTNTVIIDTAGNSYFNGGNVGINTTSPATILHIKADSNSATDFPLTIENAADSLDVGIGAYGLSNKVGTSQTSDFTMTIGDDLYLAADTVRLPDGADLIVQESDSTTSAIRLASDANEGFLQVYEDGVQKVQIRGDGDNYIIDNNVGIGTTSPTELLEISANALHRVLITATDTTMTNGADYGGIGWETNDASQTGLTTWEIFQEASGTTGEVDLVFDYKGTEAIRLDTSGNVGINNDSPTSKLHMQGATNDEARVRVSNTAGGQAGLDLDNSEGYFRTFTDAGEYRIYDQTDSAYRLLIDTSGNVGIGTTSPSTRLTVRNDSANVDNYILEIGNDLHATNTKDAWLKYVGGAATTDHSWTTGIISNTYRIVQLGARATAPSSGTERLVINSNGNVGIGETAPLVKLDVQGSPSAPATSGTAQTGSLRLSQTLGNGVLDMGFYTSSNGTAWLQSTNKADLAVNYDIALQPNGGKVGIGIASPASALHVHSTIEEVIRVDSGNTGAIHFFENTARRGIIGYSNGTSITSSADAGDMVLRAESGKKIHFGIGGASNANLNSSGQFLINFLSPASTSNFLLGVDGSIGIGGDDFIAAGAGYGPANSSAGAGTIQLYNTATGNMNFNQSYTHARYYFYHGGNEVFRIEDGGFSGIYGYSFHYTTAQGSVGVGALNTGYHHTMRQSGPTTFYWSNRCEASGGFHTYSDERFKENITTIPGALDKVALMNGVTFNWIDAENRGSGDTGKQFGVIAQNMLTVDPELPSLNPDPLATQEEIDNEELETDYYTMDYSRITPFLIEAIKELKTKLEAAEARIATLEG